MVKECNLYVSTLYVSHSVFETFRIWEGYNVCESVRDLYLRMLTHTLITEGIQCVYHELEDAVSHQRVV